jgi:hypothetical protein
MMSIVGLNASNLDIRRRILHTRIFWQLTHQSLPMQLIPWMQIASTTPWSPSLGYSTIKGIRRLCMQYSNFEAQLEPGGLLTSPPYLLITMFHGMSSTLLFTHITYLRVCFEPG